MAMTLDTAIKFTTKLDGTGLDQLKRQLQGLAAQSNRTSKDLDQLYNANRQLSAAAGTSINSLQRQITVMTNLRNEAQIGSRQFKFYTTELERLERQQSKLTGAASPNGGLLATLGSLRGGLAGATALAGAFGVSSVIGGIASTSMEAESARVRLKALADVYGEYNDAQQTAIRIARTLRLSNSEATDSFAKLYAGLRPTGVNLKELEQIFVGFNAAARTSGATAEETSAAMIQLKQSLVSGRAQGDELRSILEQAPALGQAVADAMTKTGEFGKVTRAQLKDLGAEGKISTDILIAALKNLGQSELPKLDKMFNTGQQSLTDLNNELKNFGDEIGKAFGPIAVGLIQGLTGVVHKLANEFAWLNKERGEAGVRIAANEKAFQQALKETGGTGLLSFADAKFRARYDQLRAQFLKEAQQAANPGLAQDQLNARNEAANNRNATRTGANAKALEDEVKIRREAELKLADFRAEQIKRAALLERDLSDQRLKIEQSIAEERRRFAAQQQDIALQGELLRRRAAGLDTGGLEAAQRINELFRRFSEQKIANEQNATERQVELTRKVEDFKLSVAEGVSKILQDAGDKLAEKMQKGAQGAAATLTGAAPGAAASGSIIARTGNTGDSTGPHLDIRWADGRPISKADADRYFSLGGRSPSSYGVTSPYGRRSLFGRSFHAGMDFGTPAGTPISLQGGASFGADLGNTGAGGYAALINTPQGAMKILHLSAGSVARPAGSASLPPGALSGVEKARSSLMGAIGTEKGVKNAAAFGSVLQGIQGELGGITAEFDAQVKSAKDKLQDEQRYGELLRQGITPEMAQQRIAMENIARKENEALEGARARIQQEIENGNLTEQQKAALQEIVDGISERINKQQDSIKATEDEIKAAEKLKKAREDAEGKDVGKGLRDGVKTYLESIGTLASNISDATSRTLSGLEDQLVQFVTTGKASFRDLAQSVLADMARIVARQMIIKPILMGLNALIPGLKLSANGNIFDAQGIQPFAMGGIVDRPTLFPFAKGVGLMGEAGPEAIMPLKRGADGKLGVAGGGGQTNVTVNVDAKGTSAQGDEGKGNQLARVVAQAVQAELIKQKRPGGILA